MITALEDPISFGTDTITILAFYEAMGVFQENRVTLLHQQLNEKCFSFCGVKVYKLQ